MNELDGFPGPLRPLAAQVLAAIFPWFAPAKLKRAIEEAGERERRYLARLTRAWTEQHWAALSAALSRADHVVQVRSIDEAFSLVAMQIVIESATFQVCWSNGAAAPYAPTKSGSPRLSPADIAVQIKQVSADIDRFAAQERLREAVRKLFKDEQQRSRDEAAAEQAAIEGWRAQFAKIQQSVASCAETSRRLADQRRDAERALSDAIATGSDIASRGAAALNALSRLQDQRDSLLDPASAGKTSELSRMLELEEAIDCRLGEIEELERQAGEQARAIQSRDEAISALERHHAETAEAPFDTAVKEATQMANAWRARLEALADTAAAARERKRIAAAAGDEPVLVMAQLDALDLWQLGCAPDHARKRGCSDAIRTLDKALNDARVHWRRPDLRQGGK